MARWLATGRRGVSIRVRRGLCGSNSATQARQALFRCKQTLVRVQEFRKEAPTMCPESKIYFHDFRISPRYRRREIAELACRGLQPVFVEGKTHSWGQACHLNCGGRFDGQSESSSCSRSSWVLLSETCPRRVGSLPPRATLPQGLSGAEFPGAVSFSDEAARSCRCCEARASRGEGSANSEGVRHPSREGRRWPFYISRRASLAIATGRQS